VSLRGCLPGPPNLRYRSLSPQPRQPKRRKRHEADQTSPTR
jgi:hypothetical protein